MWNLSRQSSQNILKLVNSTDKAQTTNLFLDGAKKLAPEGKLIVLKSDDLNKINSLEQPKLVSPVEQEFIVKGKTVSRELSPFSFTIV